MPRTTLLIDEGVLKALKKRAADEGRTLQDLANEMLKRGLAPTAGPRFRLRWRGCDAALQPGVDLENRDALFDLMDGR
jgi:plasmid stability protein